MIIDRPGKMVIIITSCSFRLLGFNMEGKLDRWWKATAIVWQKRLYFVVE